LELPAGFEGRRRPASGIAGQENAIRGWIAEVGRELRDVEGQIGFFRRLVESKIHGEGMKRGAVDEKCGRCRKT
jgi:hypothetical protein